MKAARVTEKPQTYEAAEWRGKLAELAENCNHGYLLAVTYYFLKKLMEG